MNIKIALAQTSASANPEDNLKKSADFIKSASDNGASIVCFPEMSFTRFFPQYYCDESYFSMAETIPGPTTDFLCGLAKKHNISIIANLLERAGRGYFYNTSPVINESGEIVDAVRMKHIAEEPLFNEKYYYHPGNDEIKAIQLKDCKIGVAICYDRHYPELMRILTLQGADIIFIPQAGIKGNPVDLYEIEMQAASFQNQVYTALVNRVGIEDKMTFVGARFVTSPDGNVASHASFDKEELQITECDLGKIDEMRIKRPFLRDRRPDLYNNLSNLDNQ